MLLFITHIHLPHHPLSHLGSIHTPARGVTFLCVTFVTLTDGFNPHSRTGSDTERGEACKDSVNVSIHTPARGVTVSNLGHLFSISYTIENANERFCIREKRVLIIYECQHIDSQDVRKFQ